MSDVDQSGDGGRLPIVKLIQNRLSLTLLTTASALLAAIIGGRSLGPTDLARTIGGGLSRLAILQSPLTWHLFWDITQLGHGKVLGPVVIAGSLCLIWLRAWQASCFLLASFGLSILVILGLKGVLGPAPSGHTGLTLAVLGAIALIAAPPLSGGGRSFVYLGCGLLVALIACSRVYLPFHHLFDVVLGVLVGMTLLALLSWWFGAGMSREMTRPKAIAFLATVTIALVLAGGWRLWWQHANFAGFMAAQHHRVD